MALSKIQWTDYTHNPWRGCRKVAPECANCYITGTTPFRTAKQTHGAVRVRASWATRKEPLKWNARSAEGVCSGCGTIYAGMVWNSIKVHALDGGLRCSDRACGGEVIFRRARVFCLSLGDVWDLENILPEWRWELLNTIRETPNLDWQLLTKRPGNWKRCLEEVLAYRPAGVTADWVRAWVHGRDGAYIAPENVWIGVSAGADQGAALDIPARVHFLSCEPMLGPLDQTHADLFDWIIFGGESGPKARQCNLTWIDQGIKFCQRLGIPCFVKQLGSNAASRDGVGELFPLKLKHPKGGDVEEWSEDLRVREFPQTKVGTSLGSADGNGGTR